MAKDKSRSGKKKSGKKASKKRIAAERKERLKAAKGDGTFPDRLIVTREKEKSAETGKTKHWFVGHNEDLSTLYEDGQTVAVYKLVRVSALVVKRKIALNRA